MCCMGYTIPYCHFHSTLLFNMLLLIIMCWIRMVTGVKKTRPVLHTIQRKHTKSWRHMEVASLPVQRLALPFPPGRQFEELKRGQIGLCEFSQQFHMKWSTQKWWQRSESHVIIFLHKTHPDKKKKKNTFTLPRTIVLSLKIVTLIQSLTPSHLNSFP